MIFSSRGSLFFVCLTVMLLILPGVAAAQYTILDDATGGDCAAIGTWDPASKTCTLTTDITVTGPEHAIDVAGHDITLDGNGHFLTGPGGYGAVYAGVAICNGWSNNTVKNFNISNFTSGILVCYYSNGNALISNTITASQGWAGIYVHYSSLNTIQDNNLSSNYLGIRDDTGLNTYVGNSIHGSPQGDVQLIYGSSGNVLDGNDIGLIQMQLSNDNTYTNNTIEGIVSYTNIEGNVFYHNNFLGNINVPGSTNIFNLELPEGGNYFANYDSPGEGCLDADGDGICDQPFNFGSGTDYLPWKVQDGWMDHDGDGSPQAADCDDDNLAVFPGAAEIPGNGVDDNCDGSIDEVAATGFVPVQEWTVPQQFGISAIAADAAGAVFATGMSDWATIHTSKYDTDGTILWDIPYQGWENGTNIDLSSRDIAVDAFGNVFVTGHYGCWAAFHSDILLLGYDPEGISLMQSTLNYGRWDHGQSIAVDYQGNMYVTGDYTRNSMNPLNPAAILVKTDPTAGVIWTQLLPDVFLSSRTDVAADQSGSAFITGAGGTMKFDPLGNAVWEQEMKGSSIAVDSAGNVYVAGGGTAKYDNDGNLLAMFNVPGASVTVDGTGSAYITGGSGTVKIDASGNVEWVLPVHGSSISVDAARNVYILSSGTILKYSPDSDGDGFGINTDCNDLDALVYPGATEIKHDGIDQDCNGYDLTIDIVRAVYHMKNDFLRVEASSSLGSAANLELEGYGQMTWNALDAKWVINVKTAGGDPGVVTVSGTEGSETSIVSE